MSSEDRSKPVIGISTGDINGIGLEVIIKAFSDTRMMQYCTPVLYAAPSVVEFHRKALDIKGFNVHPARHIGEIHHRKLNLVSTGDPNARVTFGEKSPAAGESAFHSLEAAVADARAGKLDALVTAPIDKDTIQSETFKFPGHTEYLAEAMNSPSLMFMVSETLRVGVATGHIPLSEVSARLTPKGIQDKLRLMIASLRVDFGIRKPRVAVLGLNPHAGEEGLLGHEEEEIIKPALASFRADNAIVMGPFSADGFFGKEMYRHFDGVLAMYHDQGLIPFKLLSFGKGVNFTAGLPVVRTSPDHGTAYDLAGKGEANEQSFREAVYMALDIVAHRRLYAEVNSDPLQAQLTREKEM